MSTRARTPYLDLTTSFILCSSSSLLLRSLSSSCRRESTLVSSRSFLSSSSTQRHKTQSSTFNVRLQTHQKEFFFGASRCFCNKPQERNLRNTWIQVIVIGRTGMFIAWSRLTSSPYQKEEQIQTKLQPFSRRLFPFAWIKHSWQQLINQQQLFQPSSPDSHGFPANCSASIILSAIFFCHQCNTTLPTLPAPLAYSARLGRHACHSRTVSFMYEEKTEGASVCQTREGKAKQRLL